jgi:predicted RNase H-like HicB family nuclease
MTHQAVSLKVIPCVHIECKFWLTDDGWNGSSDEPPAVVQASSFEQAKSDMELALGKHIDKLLHQSGASDSEQAA